MLNQVLARRSNLDVFAVAGVEPSSTASLLQRILQVCRGWPLDVLKEREHSLRWDLVQPDHIAQVVDRDDTFFPDVRGRLGASELNGGLLARGRQVQALVHRDD